MRLEPLQGWIVGRIAVSRKSKTLYTPGKADGITRFVYIEQASEGAKAAGFEAGMFVIPRAVYDMFFNNKDLPHAVTTPLDGIICKVHDLDLDDLVDPINQHPFRLNPAFAAPAASALSENPS